MERLEVNVCRALSSSVHGFFHVGIGRFGTPASMRRRGQGKQTATAEIVASRIMVLRKQRAIHMQRAIHYEGAETRGPIPARRESTGKEKGLPWWLLGKTSRSLERRRAGQDRHVPIDLGEEREGRGWRGERKLLRCEIVIDRGNGRGSRL